MKYIFEDSEMACSCETGRAASDRRRCRQEEVTEEVTLTDAPQCGPRGSVRHGGPKGRGRGMRAAGPDEGTHRGPPFGRGSRARRGNVRKAIFVLLDEQPMHGYQLMQTIAERSEGSWQPSAGSIYPTLQQLSDEGFVHSEDVGDRKVYSLTDSGKEHLAERKAKKGKPWDATEPADEGQSSLWVAASNVWSAGKQVGKVGTDEQIAKAQTILTETRRQLYEVLGADTGKTTSSKKKPVTKPKK